jgi:hypothetical protein
LGSSTSQSARVTRLIPAEAKEAAMLVATNVLPVPPLPLAMEIFNSSTPENGRTEELAHFPFLTMHIIINKAADHAPDPSTRDRHSLLKTLFHLISNL